MTNELTSHELGRLLSEKRPIVERVCPVDGTAFTARNPRAIYCSARCLMKARRAAAKKAAAEGEQEETGG